MPSYPTHRIIRTPSGHTFKARVIPPDTFGLGTQLDAFYMERKTEPSHYTPMARGDRRSSTPPVSASVRRSGGRKVQGDTPRLSLAVVS